jgi:hypothetical protein
VVFWTFDFQQGVLASQEFLFAALRGGRCSSAPESSWMDQTASAPTSGALLMYPFFAERPHIAVGIKGPMNFWIWYQASRLTSKELRSQAGRLRYISKAQTRTDSGIRW